MKKLMHIGDLHLGFAHRYLGPKAPQRAAEILDVLERLVAYATEDAHEVAGVLIAGDLFERHDPDRELTGRVQALLGRIPASGRTLVTVPGNHDEYSYPDSVYRRQADTWPGILVTCPQPERVVVVDLGEVEAEIYAMAFTAGLSSKRLAVFGCDNGDETVPSIKPRVRVAVLHGTLDADPTDRSYRIDRPVLGESGVSYAALGHIHKPAEHAFSGGLAVYPGTLNGKGFDDPGVDALTLVSFPAGRPEVERVPVPVRRIESRAIDLSSFSSQEDLVATVEQDLDADRILALELFGTRPPDYDPAELRGRLGTKCFHFELEDQSIQIDDDELSALEQQPTLRGLFVQKLREQMAACAGDEGELARLRLAMRKGLAAFGDGS